MVLVQILRMLCKFLCNAATQESYAHKFGISPSTCEFVYFLTY